MTNEQDVAQLIDLIFGGWRSQIAYAATTSGLLEKLASAPGTPEDLAERTGLDRARLERFLRSLTTLGLVCASDGRVFGITSMGRLLTRDGKPSLRSMLMLEAGPTHYDAWKHLTEIIKGSKKNGFELATGLDVWTHLKQNPEYREVFQDAMSSYSASESAAVVGVLSEADLPESGVLCDVAGGDGGLLGALAARFPKMTPVLFDLVEVVDSAAVRTKTSSREPAISRVGGDMFDSVPAADVYVLKHVLHDWNDEESSQILRVLRKHARKGARLFVCEFVIPDDLSPTFATLFDIHMMCVSTGRQRTSGELRSMLTAAGWMLDSERAAQGSPLSVLLSTAQED